MLKKSKIYGVIEYPNGLHFPLSKICFKTDDFIQVQQAHRMAIEINEFKNMPSLETQGYYPRFHTAEMESPLRSISAMASYTVAKLGGHEHLTVPHSNQKIIC